MAFDDPDVKITLQGKEYTIRYDLMAAAMAEKEFGGPVVPALARMIDDANRKGEIELELRAILCMMWAMLYRRYKLKIERVAELIGPTPQAAVDVLFSINRAYMAAMPKADEGEKSAGETDLPAE